VPLPGVRHGNPVETRKTSPAPKFAASGWSEMRARSLRPLFCCQAMREAHLKMKSRPTRARPFSLARGGVGRVSARRGGDGQIIPSPLSRWCARRALRISSREPSEQLQAVVTLVLTKLTIVSIVTRPKSGHKLMKRLDNLSTGVPETPKFRSRNPEKAFPKPRSSVPETPLRLGLVFHRTA